MGVIVLLDGIAPDAAHELAEELPIKVLNASSCAPETLLQQLREKGILPPQKESQQ
jgi:hypothetical protein